MHGGNFLISTRQFDEHLNLIKLLEKYLNITSRCAKFVLWIVLNLLLLNKGPTPQNRRRKKSGNRILISRIREESYLYKLHQIC